MNTAELRRLAKEYPDEYHQLLDRLPADLSKSVQSIVSEHVKWKPSKNGRCITRKVSPEEMERLWQ